MIWFVEVARSFLNCQFSQAFFHDFCGGSRKGGADPNHAIGGDEMPIHIAATMGGLNIVQVLVQAGSRIDRAEWKGDTPLHLAAFNGYLDIVKFLVDKNAPINARRISGATPLGLAEKANHQDIVNYLRTHGGTQHVRGLRESVDFYR